MRHLIKVILSLSIVIILLTACSKKDDTPVPVVPKDITGHASYININATSNIPTGIGIRFVDQDGKSTYADLLAISNPDANATISIANPDFSSALSTARVSPSSGEYIDMLPLQDNETITISIDNPITSINGITYKSLTITKVDIATAQVSSNAVALQMTSGTEASSNYPMAKAYFKTLLTKAPGRYRLKIQ